MLWAKLEIAFPVAGLVTATTLWNQIQGKRRLLILGFLMTGTIVLNFRSYFEATRNDEMMKDLRVQLEAAEQEIIEAEIIRKKVIAYGDIAKLNADGSTGLVKKGEA